AVVEVLDTGEGIADEVASRIFEPFVTTKEVGGTGLGLYVCASIVRSLGGRLSAAANQEQGSCFRVELPPAGETDSLRPRKRAPSMSGQARILVIDDEPGVLEFMVDALDGHQVVTAESGREALSIMAEQSFDLILCDLIMPEVSGMEVFERATADRPEMASSFVFMTGGAFTHKSRDFVASTSRPLLEKPFDIGDILDAVDAALAARPQAT
ncbi:MAG: response regulator, partial [Deltaproteobacteria bacterium]|nr:response regulator [Deltaproteobacteria bacterium]